METLRDERYTLLTITRETIYEVAEVMSDIMSVGKD